MVYHHTTSRKQYYKEKFIVAKQVENSLNCKFLPVSNTSSPVGAALGQAGINIMGFTKEFNARTADQAGMLIPVVISVYEDKSFTFITKLLQQQFF